MPVAPHRPSRVPTPTFWSPEHARLHAAMLRCRPSELLKGERFAELYSSGDRDRNACFAIELTCRRQIARRAELMALERSEELSAARCKRLLQQHARLLRFQDRVLHDLAERDRAGSDVREWSHNTRCWRELVRDSAQLRVALVLAEGPEAAVETRRAARGQWCRCDADCEYVNGA